MRYAFITSLILHLFVSWELLCWMPNISVLTVEGGATSPVVVVALPLGNRRMNLFAKDAIDEEARIAESGEERKLPAHGQTGSSQLSLKDIIKWGNAIPEYPDEANRRGWEGEVRLRLLFDEAGSVRVVEVAQSSGYSQLDEAAKAAALGWKIPSSLQKYRITIPVDFKLED